MVFQSTCVRHCSGFKEHSKAAGWGPSLPKPAHWQQELVFSAAGFKTHRVVLYFA